MKINQTFINPEYTVHLDASNRLAISSKDMTICHINFDTNTAKTITGDMKSLKDLNRHGFLEKATTIDSSIEHRLSLAHVLSDDTHNILASAGIYKTQLKLLLDFCHDDDHRYYATTIALVGGKLVASDSRALVCLNFPRYDGDRDAEALIPRKSLKKYLALDSSQRYTMRVYDDHCMLRGDEYVANIRTTGGRFPSYLSAIPERKHHGKVEVYEEDQIASARLDYVKARLKNDYDDHEVYYNKKLLSLVLKYSDGEVYYDDIGKPLDFVARDKDLQCEHLLLVPVKPWQC